MIEDINRTTPIKDLISENNTSQASYKTSGTQAHTPQGYFVKQGGIADILKPQDFDRQVALAKDRLLRGETIKSTDADFQMVALQPIQNELISQGYNVVYTLPSRLKPYKQLKLIPKE